MYSRKVASQLKELETPFYLYDINLLRQTLNSVVSESKKYNYKVHYAIKANYDDHLLSIIREYGLGIDCASANEVRKAIELGFDPKTIVYAGVGKRDKEIRYAIEQNILALNCESIEELQVINAIAAEMGRRVDVGLRVNPDIDPKTNHCIDTGQADSKFGIAYDEILENTELIKSLENINIIGLHLHIGSQIRELHVFENMCNKVNAIVEKLRSHGFSFRMVDVGGGLRGIYACGVLDRCLEEGVTFDLGIGVSAGSANLITFFAGQRGRNFRFYTEYAQRPEYMSLKNFLKKRSYVDLDYVYSTLSNSDGEDPLDYEAFAKNPAEFLVVATNAETGEGKYFDRTDIRQDCYDVMKASSTLPVVCRPYPIGGQLYFDGAL